MRSVIVSAWNMVQTASASTNESIASPTADAAGTAQQSLRSFAADTSFFDAISIV